MAGDVKCLLGRREREREAVAGCQRATETGEGGEERRRQRDIQGDGDGDGAAAAASGRGIALLSLLPSLSICPRCVRRSLSLSRRPLPPPLAHSTPPPPSSATREALLRRSLVASGGTPVILLLSFFFLRILILHLSISSVRPSVAHPLSPLVSLYRDYRPRRLGGNNSLVALFIISCLLSGLPHLPPSPLVIDLRGVD